MVQRKPISKKLRFEVFKRDSFTCQYCGNKAPNSILELDHINPVSKGGLNEIMNLVTSCFDCNRGKKDKIISDDSVVEKQRKQIEELNIRRQQLEMMLQWRDGEIELENLQYKKAIDYFNKKANFKALAENGEKTMTSYVKKYGLIKTLETIDIAFEKYCSSDLNNVFDKIGGILNYQTMPEHRQKISYIIGICKNKKFYVNHKIMVPLLTKFHESGCSLDALIEKLKNNEFRNYSILMNTIKEAI